MWRPSVSAGAAVAAVLLLAPSIAPAQQPDVSDLLRALPARELGPTVMGGRVSDLAVFNKTPRMFYVASASGGLWRTLNGGTTFDCVFQYEETVALGAVAVDQDDFDHVWVGTGEQNSRNSTSWGNGVYKSTDGGQNWEHIGLEDSRHISKIRMHPTDKDTVYVGALGHLWGANEERGLYKTTDGGETWENILYINDKTGVIDLIMHPEDPDTLWAATWERMRWPYRWASGGEGSGLYKTTDGGENWTEIDLELPNDALIGRIGLDIMLSKPDVMVMTVEAGQENDEGRMRPVGGFFKSTNGGEKWEKLSNMNPRPFYFSMPRIDPNDEDRVYVPAVNFAVSDDGGRTFRNMEMNIHVDHHAMWINPEDSNHMIIGEDGGIAQTRDRGDKWEFINTLPIAQFYAIGVDMRKPYWIYGGLQDNGTWGGPTQTNKGFVAYSDWRFINGGDGFHAQINPDNWRIVYAESQGGGLVRHNIESGERRFIRPNPPRPAAGEEREQYRFNWSAPIVISPHNPETVWFGGNRLFKSVDQGDNWTVMSPDLTTDDPAKQQPRAGATPEDTGAERHCTIVTISESPLKQGVVWIGTDDGNVQLTRDDGATWVNMIDNVQGVPEHTWVSRVAASRHELGRAYVTFDGHRNNDYKPYIYVTEDFGQTWTPLHQGFGDESVYVIVEGTVNPDLLVVGTEMGLYFSLDRGQSWTRYHKENNFPTVRVDDLVIHPREKDLVVGTHGRGIWIVPIHALEQMTPENLDEEVVLLESGTMYNLGRVYGGWFEGDRIWTSPNTQPAGTVYYYLKSDSDEKITVEFFNAEGQSMGSVDGEGNAGLNSVNWRPRGRAAREMVDGLYRVVLTVGDTEYISTIRYEDISKNMRQ